MDFKFDHVVHYTNDPNEAISVLREYGIHAVEGGQHQSRSTYNVLSYFDLSYIEFISSNDKRSLEETEHPENSLMATLIKNKFKEGFARFVMRTSDIEKTANRFREKGLHVIGPVPLSRKSPDGTLIEWQLLFVGEQQKGLEYPYFIQWNEQDGERRQDLIERKVVIPGSMGATFSHIKIAVHDVEATVKKWSDLFDLPIGKTYLDEEIQAKCIPLTLPGGNIVFCSPIEDGVVSKILSTEGEKIFQVELVKQGVAQTFELLGGSYKMMAGY